MSCNKETNLISCTCTYSSCSRKGLCCECVTYHRKNGEIPGCFFTKSGEASYDRSITAFIKDHGK